jgi:hypothetical protein
MVYSTGEDLQENVYYVHKGTTWSEADINNMLTIFSTWESTIAADERSVDVSLVRMTGTDITSLTGRRVDLPLVAPIAGQDASPVLPANVTFAVKSNIGERGKGRNGRKFWIGLSEAMVTKNLLDETRAGDIQQDLNDLISAVVAGPPAAALGVIHTHAAGVPLEPATFSAIVNFAYTDLTLDSQRDRLPGHKRHKRPAA